MSMFRKTRYSEKEERFDLFKAGPTEKNSTPRKLEKNRHTNAKKSRSNSKPSFKVSSLTESRLRSKSREEIDEEYLSHCKHVIKKYNKLIEQNPKNCRLTRKRYEELKRCEKCGDFVDDLLLCNFCEDAYHPNCLNLNLDDTHSDRKFTCPPCLKEMKKQTKIDEIFTPVKNKKQFKKCPQCEENVDKCNDEEAVKTCFKCKLDFHSDCFRKEVEDKQLKAKSKQKIICGKCENKVAQILKKATRISDYFKPDKNAKLSLSPHYLKKVSNEKLFVKFNDTESVDSTSSSLLSLPNLKNNSKIKTEWLPKFKVSKDLREEYSKILKESLIRAFLVKGIKFNDDLCFNDVDCPSEMNNASNEPGIQVISDYNKVVYYKFKEKTRRGEYPALEIVDEEKQGFIVRAIDDIPALTLICEYSGDVTLARKRIFDNNDSIMDLIRTPSSSTSLVICPENSSNIARFISGINNHAKGAKKKQNVSSIRYNIDGEVHILLYAVRIIRKNEVLYYDYNAGGFGGYPTENFV